MRRGLFIAGLVLSLLLLAGLGATISPARCVLPGSRARLRAIAA